MTIEYAASELNIFQVLGVAPSYFDLDPHRFELNDRAKIVIPIITPRGGWIGTIADKFGSKKVEEVKGLGKGLSIIYRVIRGKGHRGFSLNPP